MTPLQSLEHIEAVIRSMEFRTRELAQWMETNVIDACSEVIEDGLLLKVISRSQWFSSDKPKF